MFANLLSLFSSRRPNDAFVEQVEIRERFPRNRGVERVLVLGWVLIGCKAAFTYWAASRYSLPFSPGWLVWPTVAFGLLCTAIYAWRLR